MTFYNEIDPYAVQWLKNLIAAGHIAHGQVDARSIEDIAPEDCGEQSHFFAGIGIWSLAFRMAGLPDDFPAWSGSCPCQPFSVAGKGRGTDDERHLFPAWLRLIDECRPPIVFGEQVASPLGRAWLNSVFLSLEALGYRCAGADLCAAGVGAPHIRQRVFWVAYADVSDIDQRLYECLEERGGETASAGSMDPWNEGVFTYGKDGIGRLCEPKTHLVAPRDSSTVGRVRAYGNAISPQVAATFIQASLEAIAGDVPF